MSISIEDLNSIVKRLNEIQETILFHTDAICEELDTMTSWLDWKIERISDDGGNYEDLPEWEDSDENTSAYPEAHEEQPKKPFLVMSMNGDRWFDDLELAKRFAERAVESGSTDWAFVAEKGVVVAEYRRSEKNE